jgi:hypothetical protein
LVTGGEQAGGLVDAPKIQLLIGEKAEAECHLGILKTISGKTGKKRVKSRVKKSILSHT